MIKLVLIRIEWGEGIRRVRVVLHLRPQKSFIHIVIHKIDWTDHVRNEEILYIVKEQGNIPYAIKIRKANWICYILRRTAC